MITSVVCVCVYARTLTQVLGWIDEQSKKSKTYLNGGRLPENDVRASWEVHWEAVSS